MADANDYLMENGERDPSDEARINAMLEEVCTRLKYALAPLEGSEGYISTVAIYNDTVYPLLGAEVSAFGEVIDMVRGRLWATRCDEIDGQPVEDVDEQP